MWGTEDSCDVVIEFGRVVTTHDWVPTVHKLTEVERKQVFQLSDLRGNNSRQDVASFRVVATHKPERLVDRSVIMEPPHQWVPTIPTLT